MATAADYRKWAEECFAWAREASDESVREQYASLGRVWLECAARAEVRSGVITPPETETTTESGLAAVGSSTRALGSPI
jgi:hypothetical protein